MVLDAFPDRTVGNLLETFTLVSEGVCYIPLTRGFNTASEVMRQKLRNSGHVLRYPKTSAFLVFAERSCPGSRLIRTRHDLTGDLR